VQSVVALLIELLQAGRAVGRRPCEAPRSLVGPAAEAEVSQLEV
jgi:hypothetical protein